MKHNPPFIALRTFEAAARHQSFAKAAEELAVTPTAVSHQIKKLEEYLGVTLFERMPQRLVLSPVGRSMLPGIQSAFEQLDGVIGRFFKTGTEGLLTLSVAPVFASKWLVPHLMNFNESHPDIDVRISSRLELVDFQRDDFDAAIRLCHEVEPGLEAIPLFNEWVTPLCSPDLLKGKKAIRSPKDLGEHVLLHDDSMVFDASIPTWTTWLQAAKVMSVNVSRGPHFSHPDHAIQAAIDGVGVLLGWRNLASDDIVAGRLVQPFNLTLPMGPTFQLVYPQSHAQRISVLKFKKWLLDELSQTHFLSRHGIHQPSKD